MENVNAINERIVALKTKIESPNKSSLTAHKPDRPKEDDEPPPENKGRVIFDATACPQDITYPTDLNLLSEAR